MVASCFELKLGEMDMQDFIIKISAVQQSSCLPSVKLFSVSNSNISNSEEKIFITVDIFNDIPVSLPSLTKQKERTTAAIARKINTLCVRVCLTLSLARTRSVCVFSIGAPMQAFMSLYHRDRSKS